MWPIKASSVVQRHLFSNHFHLAFSNECVFNLNVVGGIMSKIKQRERCD